MNGRPSYQPIDFLGDPPPRDFLILMAVLFVTFSMGFFPWTQPLMGLLYLSPDVWQRGFLWQLVTYLFAALPDQPFWFLVTLLILYLFGKQVRSYLRRRQFWQLLLQAGLTASLVAVGVQLLISAAGWRTLPFLLMQGDRMVLAILIAAYATMFRQAVIRLFFVLPIKARDFLWLEILFAFMAFLTTRDFAGFVGITTAVATTYGLLTGGLRKMLREWRLRIERLLIEMRLRFLRRKRKMRLVKPDDGGDARRQDPWVH
jgi:hypothetical protein